MATYLDATGLVQSEDEISGGWYQENVALLSEMVKLGTAYSSLDPITSNDVDSDPSNWFLDTLWRAENSSDIQKGRNELKEVFDLLDEADGVSNSVEALTFAEINRKQFTVLEQTSELQPYVRDSDLLAGLTIIGGSYAYKYAAYDSLAEESFYVDLRNAETEQDLQSIAANLNQEAMLTPNLSDVDGALAFLLRKEVNRTGGIRVESVYQPSPDNEDISFWTGTDTSQYPFLGNPPGSIPTGGQNALVLNPMGYENVFQESTNETNAIESILIARGFAVEKFESLQFYRAHETNLEIFTNPSVDNSEFDVISIVSHGMITSTDQQAIFSGVFVNPQRLQAHQEELLSGELDTYNHPINYSNGSAERTIFLLTPKFVKNQMKVAPNAIVYLGICDGSSEDELDNMLADAFMDNGAQSVLGYTNDVSTDFAYQHGLATFNQLASGVSTGDIVGLGNIDLADNAEFKLFGATNAVLSPS